ncbi:unnamed protein product, partial [Didymodactylos carnosus]
MGSINTIDSKEEIAIEYLERTLKYFNLKSQLSFETSFKLWCGSPTDRILVYNDREELQPSCYLMGERWNKNYNDGSVQTILWCDSISKYLLVTSKYLFFTMDNYSMSKLDFIKFNNDDNLRFLT